MFVILRNRFLRPQHLLAPNLLIVETKTLISPFSSLHSSSDSSESKPNSTSKQREALFISYGFTQTEISKLAKNCPRIHSAKLEKTVAPKLEFLLSIGIPKSHLPKLLCSSPVLLGYSLQNHLIPCHNYFKKLLDTDENVVKLLLRKPRIFGYNLDKIIAPNIKLMTRIGVPESHIFYMLFRYATVVCETNSELTRIVEEAIRMGFVPTKFSFCQALHVYSDLHKATFDRKWKVYKSWGLSDDEVGIIFRSYPLCMALSDEKITKAMDIFVNEMGREAAEVAGAAYVLCFSVENRIKPRCKVIKVLTSKGLLKKSIALGTFLYQTEAKFLEKFVSKFENIVPGLLSIYQERKVSESTEFCSTKSRRFT